MMNNDQRNLRARTHRRTLETVIFAMLGTLMYCSKVIMESIPNVHLLGMFIMVFTLVYRKKALIPIYIFVMLTGLFGGFAPWWVAYLYVWTVLWGVTMLLPQNMPTAVACVVYPIVCALHGFAFGTLCAPAEALVHGLGAQGMLVWILRGIPYDLIHGLGNFCAGLLIVPLRTLLEKLMKTLH